jgi:hypothetical protein
VWLSGHELMWEIDAVICKRIFARIFGAKSTAMYRHD